MTRRERIITLLDHYLDVENGLQDRAFRGDDYLPRMCRAWSHPSYVELRRIIGWMQTNEARLYWPLAETYFRYREVRVAKCPRCHRQYPAGQAWDEDKGEGGMCRHGQTSVRLIPDIARKVSLAVRPEELSQAIDWLEENFVGEPFIPDDLLALVA